MRPVKPSVESSRRPVFDLEACLKSAGPRTTGVRYQQGEVAFSQGDLAGDVRFIREGSVKLSVLSQSGKEAVVSILGSGDFFGEGALAGQARRIETATAVTATSVLVIEKDAMVRLLHTDHALSDRFISHMLTRNMRIEADLVDQLFNSSEKRLARTLLLLARYGHENPARTLPKISQETLAEMIGTTRSRVNVFMNKFKKLGLIEYETGSDVTINDSLINIILHD
jgi:CRP/FNR family transcriptional regulator, cyclic AMP receptor protein